MSLIEKLKRGDLQSLELLVIECKQQCLSHLRMKTGCTQEEAVEIFTEAVVVIAEKVVAGKVDNIMNINAYMVGVCHNMWLNLYRNKVKNEDNKSDIERYFYEYMEEEPEDQIWEFREKLLEISEKALETLSERCQSLIRYFYIEERRMKEIVELMGFASADVAKSSKYKCFKRLREQVAQMEQTIS